MSRIIFLDIDGVMLPTKAYYLKQNESFSTPLDLTFDPIGVALLNRIARDIEDVRVVLNSTWVTFNLEKSRSFASGFLLKQGLNLRLHEDWDAYHHGSGNRFKAIQKWLDRHPEVTEYVVLDDQCPDPAAKIKIDPNEGITYDVYLRTRECLGAPESAVFLI